MALTEAQIRKAVPETKMYKMTDGLGLHIQVRPNGAKVFVKEYRFLGKRRSFTIGEFPAVKLADARLKTAEINKMVKAGEDPKPLPAEPSVPEAAGDSDALVFVPVERRFETIADRFIEKRVAEGIAEATEKKLRWNLGFAKNHFQGRDIGSIEPPEVLELVEKVQAQGKLEKAKDVHRKVGQVFDYGIGIGMVKWNPAQMIKRAVIRTKGGRHPGLVEPTKVAGLMRAISGYDGHIPTRAGLTLSALCVLRSTELRLAKRQEIDLETARWTVPADRMKGHYGDHIVPLSEQAVTVLHGLIEWLGIDREPEAYLFPSTTHKDRPISENTLNSALRRLGYDTRKDHCQHGFRTTFSTNMNEQGWNRDWIERQLCHVDRDEVRSAYNKALYLDGRTNMMQAYSDWLYEISQA